MKPIYHFTPAKNWMNDPNGLCQVDGLYHMYFQYNPSDSVWGDMHWGHAVSRDLLHWEEREVAMAPALEKGEIHCFSGGCCKDENGCPHFFYTSVGRKEDGRDARHGAQQWYAEPAEGRLNHLIQTDVQALTMEIHGGLQLKEWRDPCVLRWKDQYLMVLGGLRDERGCVMLYTSPDMRCWTYRRMLVEGDQADGAAYECPNLFFADGRAVLLYSPYGAVEALVGELDDELNFRVLSHEVLDPGGRQGFYAPQVFQDEQNRVIMLGWMPECDGDERARQRGFSGAMTLPRILSVRDDRLHAAPLDTVWTLAEEGEPRGRHYLAQIRCAREVLPLQLTLHASPDGTEKTVLTLDPEGVLTLDRSCSSWDEEPDKSPISRSVRLREEIDLFLAADGSALECCVDGQWLSGRVYPSHEQSGGLHVQAQGNVKMRTGVIRRGMECPSAGYTDGK
ncbi:MAG: glycoside hydrolase family 32 protein [Clostridia bacterium]|nr:glycoside hydrolase family 32 protein [Clostridia bacterium]